MGHPVDGDGRTCGLQAEGALQLVGPVVGDLEVLHHVRVLRGAEGADVAEVGQLGAHVLLLHVVQQVGRHAETLLTDPAGCEVRREVKER